MIQDNFDKMKGTMQSLLEQQSLEAQEKAALRTQLMEAQTKLQQQNASLLEMESASELLKVRLAFSQCTRSLRSAHQT